MADTVTVMAVRFGASSRRNGGPAVGVPMLRWWMATLVLVAVPGCANSGGRDVAGRPTPVPLADTTVARSEVPAEADSDVPESGDGGNDPTSDPTSDPVDPRPLVDVDVDVDPDSAVIDIDPRILGSNVPAWLGAERLGADWFRTAVVESGVTLLRMPGGSWSNRYDWLGCELADENRCRWTWAARPSDFVDLLQALGLDGMWTVSINHTAQSAAALVAFFNGSVDDTTAIGADRNGEDWRTVGEWAALRVAGGHAEPVGVQLWEVGNEVYGGKPDVGGDQCASFGWETVWTCDGTEYVLGDDDHDGFLAIRAAMLEVDPTIEVGAVGVADPNSWADWGSEVIEAAGDELDFYVVHNYGFNRSPSVDEAVDRPASEWPRVFAQARHELAPGVPLAITEYNLIAFAPGDEEASMTRVLNALFIADSIGQFAVHEVAMANQWNMANGVLDAGTDYGLVHADTGARYPQFDAVQIWSRAGDELLAHHLGDGLDDLRVYPTRRDDGTLAILAFNFDESPRDLTLSVGSPVAGAAVTSSTASDAMATVFERVGPNELPVDDEVISAILPPWSLNLIEVTIDG